MNVIIVPCLHDNYSYLISNEDTGETAVVDPSEAWPVLQSCAENKLSLKTVICTHHHADHIGGLDDLLEEVGQLRVIGFRGDLSRIPQLNDLLDDGQQFSVCGMSATMLHTPGHTTGGVVYYIDNCLFTGDTLFGGGCGRLFEGTPEQMLASLDKLSDFPDDALVYCGHEYTSVNLNFARTVDPDNEDLAKRLQRVMTDRAQGKATVPSTLGEERKTNPFLRCRVSSFVKQVEKHHQLEDISPVGVFRVVREMRNNFS